MKSYTEIFEDRVKDFKTLIIYYCVTRPQYQHYKTPSGKLMSYKDSNGKFSKSIIHAHMSFLGDWDKKTKREKNRDHYEYANKCALFNYCFGIPSELISSVLGNYRDENGKQHRISVEDAVQRLVQDDFVSIKNGGCGFKKVDGKWKKTSWWNNKYLIKNEKYWNMLIDDARYSDILNFPNASDRIKKIIIKYHKVKSQTESEEVTRQEQVTKQNVQFPMISFNDFKKFYSYGGVSDLYFDLIAMDIFKVSEDELNRIHDDIPHDPPNTLPNINYTSRLVWGGLLHVTIPMSSNVPQDTIDTVHRKYEYFK